MRFSLNPVSVLAVFCLLFARSALAAMDDISLSGQALAHFLEPADPSTVQGQQFNLSPFTLTLLTNTTHALISFQIPQGRDSIGWVAVGFGTSMIDSAMVILWPSSDYTRYVLSARSTGGHSMPLASSVNYTNYFTQLTSMDTLSIRSGCIATFIRPLEFPADQTIYPQGKTSFLNLSRTNTAQNLIYAYSSDRPDADAPDSMLDKHDPDMTGALSINLAQTFSVASAPSDKFAWKHKAILVHAALAMLVFTVLAPMGVLIGRFCRGNPKWLIYHRAIQGYTVAPLLGLVLILGLLGGSAETPASSTHQALGMFLFILVACQVALGFTAHRTPAAVSLGSLAGDPRAATRTTYRAIHIVLGVVVMIVGFVQVQLGVQLYAVYTLSSLYQILSLAIVILFTTLYLGSLVGLVRLRHREGRTWVQSFFGLGLESASPPRSKLSPRRSLAIDIAAPVVIEGGPYRDVKIDDGSTITTPRRRSFAVDVHDGLDDLNHSLETKR